MQTMPYADLASSMEELGITTSDSTHERWTGLSQISADVSQRIMSLKGSHASQFMQHLQHTTTLMERHRHHAIECFCEAKATYASGALQYLNWMFVFV